MELVLPNHLVLVADDCVKNEPREWINAMRSSTDSVGDLELNPPTWTDVWDSPFPYQGRISPIFPN